MNACKQWTLAVILTCMVEWTLGRVQVTLPVAVHLSRDRDYSRLLPGGRRGPPSDSTVRRYFTLQSKLILLKDGDPQHILDAFCNIIFPLSSPVLLYINNPYYHISNAAAPHYFRTITQFLGIPLITWDPEYLPSSQPDDDSRVLVISPTIQHQVDAMVMLLERFNWTYFSVVTTTVSGHDVFIKSVKDVVSKSLKKSGRDNPNKMRFNLLTEVVVDRKSGDEEQVCDRMKALLVSDSRVSLVYSRRSDTYVLMECAEKLNMTGPDYVWVLSMDSIPKNTKTWVSSNRLPFGLFGVWYDFGQNAMISAMDTTVAIWTSALKKTVSGYGRRATVKMPTPSFSCRGNATSFWSAGASMYENLLRVSTYNKKGHKIDFNAFGQLKHPELKILNVQRSANLAGRNWTVVGKWNRDGLTLKKITWPGEALGPPKGKPKRRFVRITTLRENPYVIYQPMPEQGECRSNSVPCHIYPRDKESFERVSNDTVMVCCTGLTIDLLKKLSEELDFDYKLTEVYDGQWGAEVNGEWNGLVRVLMDKQADMVITSLKINPERATAADFSVPFLKTGITIIVSIREGAISPTAFLEPYDYPSWCFILVFSVHATGASIFIFEWLSPYGLDKGNSFTREHRFSLFRSLWLIWAMLFSAAVTTDTPRGVSSRFMANLWALFALVFLASYTANLAAFMITKEEYYDLSGIQDWRLQNPKALKPPFKFGTIPHGSTEMNIKNNHWWMYKYMQRFNRPSVAEGIKAVKRGQLQAFIYDATVLEYLAGQDKGCRLITVGKWTAMTGYGVAFPRGSPWMDEVNDVILRLKEQGEMERLQKFWLAGACHTTKKKNSHSTGFGKGAKSTTLGIRNFTSAFIFLAGGIGLGAVLLFIEHLYFRFGRKKMQKCNKRGCCALISLSMGKSLTFQQSVIEVVDVHKRHRCRDRVCQSHYHRVQVELDQALQEVDKLQGLLTQIKQEKCDRVMWTFEAEERGQNNVRPSEILRQSGDHNHVTPSRSHFRSDDVDNHQVTPKDRFADRPYARPTRLHLVNDEVPQVRRRFQEYQDELDDVWHTDDSEEEHVDGGSVQSSRRRQGNAEEVPDNAAQAEKIKDELMKLLQNQYQKESVI